MFKQVTRRALLGTALAALFISASAFAETSILNASYDVARELYKDYNPVFVKYYEAKTGEKITVNQSHGASSKQARSVADGLEADVVTMNQANDIDLLHDRGNLVPADWAKRLPNRSVPYQSTMVFLVRKGNPKGIKDWPDLLKPGVQVIIPNPKTAGNGRYTYLAAWGYVIKSGGDEAKARDFVTKLFNNVPILDTGGRGATATFTQRGIGDVLITFENEVFLIKKELGSDYDIVYPSWSIAAESPVSVVDKIVDKRGTRKVAEAYLRYLYSEEAQEIAAKHHYRPVDPAIAKKYAGQFQKINLFTIDDMFGGWKQAQDKHFDDGGIFDQIYQAKK
ncbi:MAG TPA: sulfate ABC transporter substrate-binding protein [Burkholderiales bacterium]|nr:sulfate ABC transporter substrate-binding protein [Burkholderiales bacterium]